MRPYESSRPPFDLVVITRDATHIELSLPEFAALPLHERAGLILERAVEFYDHGKPVDRQDALKFLRVWRGQS
jgi:hypothetical protein